MMRAFWAKWHTRTSLVRHTMVVYVLSVMVTCSLGAALTYGALRHNLEADAKARLMEDARAYGLAVFSRLVEADRILGRLTPNSFQDIHGDPESPLAAVRFVRPDASDGTSDSGAGQGADRHVGQKLHPEAGHDVAQDLDPFVGPEVGQARARELALSAEQGMAGTAVLDSTIVFAHDGARTLPVLVRQVPGTEHLFAVGWIRPDYLWGDADRVPERVRLCIGGPPGSFRICRPEDDQTAPAGRREPADNSRLTVRWPLFLRARFGVDDWPVEASQTQDTVLAPLGALRYGAIPLSGAAVLVAVLSGTVLIRRSFRPLERLLADWKAPNGAPTGADARELGEFEQLSAFLALSAARLDRSRCLLDVLTELDRKILIAGSAQATLFWLLPRIATKLGARGAAILFAPTPEEADGTLYVAGRDGPPSSCSCEVSIQSVRNLLDSEGTSTLGNLEGALAAALVAKGFCTGRAYPIRDERHLVGALLLLDVPQWDAENDRLGLAFSDRLSVIVSYWRRKEELAHATHFDSLTGLANRELLLERLGRALAKNSKVRSLAVMLIGFDGFENINATLGHRAADELLRLAAHRIRMVAAETPALLRQSLITHDLGSHTLVTHTLARLTSNELVLFLPDLDEPANAAVVADKIITAFDKPFFASGLSYAVSVSIGIAVAPADGVTPEGLIRSAETAMRRSKQGTAGRIAFFKEVMNDHARRKVWLEHGLRGAMGTAELQLHFQPKMELATGRVTGAEALLRWVHPEEGVIPPGEFIPTAEASGLIVPIGQWVLEESCRRLLEWRRSGMHLDHIAVNLSLRQLQDDSFCRHLLQLLATTGIDGRSLELEVTESLFAERPGQLSGALEQIRRRGVRIAIDDFGMGYSSLALLQLLPVDVLKIDRAFVSQIQTGTGDAIVKAIIALGLALDKDLVAEGVETESQARALEQRGCRNAQGFYFAPALPADDFVRFVRSRQGLTERGPRALRA